MQQYIIQSNVQYGGATYSATGGVRVPTYENTALPIVVLLHGTSGNLNDMANPAVHPGFNYNKRTYIPPLREHGWRSYPGVSVWSHEVDPLGAVTGWQGALNAAGFRTVNYAQVNPSGSLTVPTVQLAALMRDLMNDPRHAGRTFSLVGHSRGGILARAIVIHAASQNSFNLGRIRHLITLHSPNQGSSLANIAITVAQLVAIIRATPGGALIQRELDFIQREAGSMAYHDYRVGSPFLQAMAAREPVGGIRYFTFGGNSTAITRHRLWLFTADSALPQWHLPPFYWRTVPSHLGQLVPPGLPLPPELLHGIGDLLVTDANARLPWWAPHRTNGLNHAEALWDGALQQQVIALLRG